MRERAPLVVRAATTATSTCMRTEPTAICCWMRTPQTPVRAGCLHPTPCGRTASGARGCRNHHHQPRANANTAPVLSGDLSPPPSAGNIDKYRGAAWCGKEEPTCLERLWKSDAIASRQHRRRCPCQASGEVSIVGQYGTLHTSPCRPAEPLNLCPQ